MVSHEVDGGGSPLSVVAQGESYKFRWLVARSECCRGRPPCHERQSLYTGGGCLGESTKFLLQAHGAQDADPHAPRERNPVRSPRPHHLLARSISSSRRKRRTLHRSFRGVLVARMPEHRPSARVLKASFANIHFSGKISPQRKQSYGRVFLMTNQLISPATS